jgi:hypothetical protein
MITSHLPAEASLPSLAVRMFDMGPTTGRATCQGGGLGIQTHPTFRSINNGGAWLGARFILRDLGDLGLR